MRKRTTTGSQTSRIVWGNLEEWVRKKVQELIQALLEEPAVTVREAPVPLPGTSNDFLQGREFRRPAQFVFRPGEIGYQAGRITPPGGEIFHGDFPSGDSESGLDYFQDGMPPPATEVVGPTCHVVEVPHCQQMRLGNIPNMEIVAQAGAIFSGKVLAENRNRFPL